MRGLIAVTPIAITIAILVWLFSFLENLIGGLIKEVIGKQYYFPGLGILVALIFIFFVGLIINNFLIQKVYGLGDKLLNRIPLVKTLYGSVTDLMSFFKKEDESKGSRVVIVELQEGRLVGLVTRETFEGLPEGFDKEDEIAVFIPMSYQIGGFTVMIPRSKVKPIAMTVEEGMRFVVTAGAPGKK